MKDLNIYLQKIILVLILGLFIVFIFLLGTHKFFNESIFASIILIFWGIIISMLFLIYKYFKKNIFLIFIIFILIFIIFSMINGFLYQQHTNKLNIGMDRQVVENLYGSGTSGIGFGSNGLGVADCKKCNGMPYQFSYKLKTNLWYSHLEDSYHVCYINEKVCDYARIGL